MRHLFLNSPAALAPATWREAFPGAKIAAPDAWRRPDRLESVVCWLRVVTSTNAQNIIAALLQHGAQAVVVMSDQPAEPDAAASLSQGASGYCNTYAAPEVLQHIAAVVEHGGLWLGPDLMQRILRGANNVIEAKGLAKANGAWKSGLTEREIQVAQYVAQGANNKEIARQLDITERTIKAHLSVIFEKLKVRDRLQLSLCVNGLWP